MRTFFSNSVFDEKDTVLHQVVRSSQTLKQIKKFLASQDTKYLLEMCASVNNKGEVPLDLVDNSQLVLQEKAEAKKILLDLMLKGNQFKISMTLKLKDLKKNLTIPLTQELIELLKQICSAVNETHKIIKKSSTHPETNQFSVEAREALRDEIEFNKKLIQNQLIQLLHTKLLKKTSNKEVIMTLVQNASNKLCVQTAYRTHKGNCEDFCLVAAHLLETKYKLTCCEVFSIEKGGHVILVLHRQKKTNPRDFTTWNLDTILCDVHLGLVFDLGHLKTSLRCWRPYKMADANSHLNVLTHFNSHYHSLEPYTLAYQQKEEVLLMSSVYYFLLTLAAVLTFGLMYTLSFMFNNKNDGVLNSELLAISVN